MATNEMADIGSADLLMDDKWLSSILGEEEEELCGSDKKGVKRKRPNTKNSIPRTICSIPNTVDSVPNTKEDVKGKRQRKEKKIFDPSAVAEVAQAKRRKRLSGTRKEKDALLLHQSLYRIRKCFVKLERIHVTTNNILVAEKKTEATENASTEKWENVNVERQTLFALSEDEKRVLETFSFVKKAESGLSETILPCPKCHRQFFSLNNLKLHIDSGHQYFTVKVSHKQLSVPKKVSSNVHFSPRFAVLNA